MINDLPTAVYLALKPKNSLSLSLINLILIGPTVVSFGGATSAQNFPFKGELSVVPWRT